MKSCRFSSALVGLCLVMAGLASAQRFVKAPVYSEGNYPSGSVVSGDFNRDGNADLAFVGSTTSGVLTIRLGIGNGKFSKGQEIDSSAGGCDVTFYPCNITSGDWNNDGVVDLAVASSKSDSIIVLLGNGDGTFTMGGSFDEKRFPTRLTSGDLNGDGIEDLVVADGGVSVLLGLGGGKFGKATQVNIGNTGQTVGVAVADFNGDRKLDIAANGVDSYDGVSNVGVALGKGDGSFGPATVYGTAYECYSNLVVADFNKDGILDLADSGGSDVAVHLGKGDGTFEIPAMFASSGYGVFLATADWNNDGNLDFISVEYGTNVVGVLLSTGGASYKGATLYGSGPCPVDVAVGDFNRDGNVDAILPDSCDTNFAELVGDGTGKFTDRRSYYTESYPNAVSVAAGYLDGDKNLDLVVADLQYKQLHLMPGNKQGAFRMGTTYSVTGGPNWVTTADLNTDGKTDVVTADEANNTVSVFLGNGNGTLQGQMAYSTAHGPVFVIAADVNGNGKPDLLSANKSGGSFSVLLASGSGFLPHVDYTTTSPAQLGLGDFSRDGKLDVAVVSASGSITLWLGKGDGTFTQGVTLSDPAVPVSIAVGDLNSDANVDLVVADSATSTVSIYLGNGDGTFQARITSTSLASAAQVMLADFDADGKLDVVLVAGSSPGNASAVLLPGKGDGTFRQAQIYTVDNTPTAEAIGDFNADGALDLAVTNGKGDTVSVLLNVGTK
ncbi:MAG: VCBS repeat-containing protein [Acidobacteriales bacterium]|nr:VCBS repeat-containing protein [Terriglobales bacterium]